MSIFLWILQIVAFPLLAPLGVGCIRKVKALLQNRQGASPLQPYRDLWKLFHKDEVISVDASWIFRWAPFIVLTSTIVVGAMVPLAISGLHRPLTGDILLVIYTLSVGTFFLALAGLDTGSAFGGFGSSREMTLAALAEGGFIFSLVTMALASGSTDPFAIAGTQLGSHAVLPMVLAGIGFFIVLLAENARFPFDNPSTHLELTMVHEAMILEYSGKRLALMEWAAANKLLLFASIGVNLFFPWGLAQHLTLGAVLLSFVTLMLKLAVVYLAIALLESSMAKFRFFRLPDLLFIAFILNFFAIVLL